MSRNVGEKEKKLREKLHCAQEAINNSTSHLTSLRLMKNSELKKHVFTVLDAVLLLLCFASLLSPARKTNDLYSPSADLN
jgi:hypothetical protein